MTLDGRSRVASRSVSGTSDVRAATVPRRLPASQGGRFRSGSPSPHRSSRPSESLLARRRFSLVSLPLDTLPARTGERAAQDLPSPRPRTPAAGGASENISRATSRHVPRWRFPRMCSGFLKRAIPRPWAEGVGRIERCHERAGELADCDTTRRRQANPL